MKRIAIDMDEVIADALGKLISLYNDEFAYSLTKELLYGKTLREVVSEERYGKIDEYLECKDFFADLEVMEGSQQVIYDLSKHYEIFITTAAMEVPRSFDAKYYWLQEHFPFIPASHIVFCGDKSIIAADYLIDDNVRHFRRFQGEGILFTSPHNVHVTGYRRVNNWAEVKEMFLAAKPGEASTTTTSN